ncbi:hypothetical protein VspSTUT16_17560 [Vibrio sp. STUT-A16]|nr:hypothetical protein VspSTUT16_17560 [Vibrio sp. STUT-A16]
MDEQKIRNRACGLLVDTLQSIPQYREWFQQIHGSDNITIDNVTDAIAAFVRQTRHLIYG